MYMEDTEIIELYWRRLEAAITETSKKYGNYCHSIVFRITKNEEDTAECVNDTWLRAWNAIPPHRPDKLSSFLGRISRNLALDRCKSKVAQKRGEYQMDSLCEELEQCIASPDNVESYLDERYLMDCINTFLRGLTDSHRIIFVLRYWHAYSIGEIAERFHMTEGRVTSILFRDRKALRKALEKEGIVL
ncbi:MAG: RNA polymerase sigma factor [Butyrivibrio sp.]|nr:RNA polymerase sigma factor [Muribaculum sp.]MCM1552535.1 RNA polymerase sigma factor [Butyrivibrio sp.]